MNKYKVIIPISILVTIIVTVLALCKGKTLLEKYHLLQNNKTL